LRGVGEEYVKKYGRDAVKGGVVESNDDQEAVS
jgi:hypothetical protein